MSAATPAARQRGIALTLAVAAGALALALDDGASQVTNRSVAAIIGLWAVLLAVAFSVWPRARIPRAALACAVPFGAFVVFTGLSALWAPSPERAFLEFERVGLYAVVLAVAVLATRPGDGRRWADGLALAIAVVGGLALTQRLFPGVMPETDIPRLLPAAGARLSYPLGYWNGLAVFLALGVPLLLRAAIAAGTVPWRAAAVVPLPALAGAIYLPSSRGGVVAAAVGVVVFVACTPRRFAAVQALVVVGAGAALVVGVLDAHPALVDRAPGSAAAEDEGPGVAALVALVCIGCGAAYGLLTAIAPPRLRLSRPLAVAATVVAALAAGAAVAAADPAERFRDFKAPPVDSSGQPDFVRSHLLSGAGSGRWQFWDAALGQWQERPVAGQGAGSFEPWWAQHGSIDWFVRNAHSLWLETLGELGLVGLLLLAAAFVAAIAGGAARLRPRPDRASDGDRSVAAALLAAVAAFALGASIDWIWQVPAIAAVAVACLGLLTGPATAPGDARAAPRLRFAERAAVVLAAWVAIFTQAIPLLVTNEIRASQEAAARGELDVALDRAASARAIQPWAASPRLQLALVREEQGDLAGARGDIAAAIGRDQSDWRLRLVAARLETKAGDIPAARAALRQARRLNPRSPALRRRE